MIRTVAKVLVVLNSENERPSQISLAVCFALIAGLTPFFNIHNLLILLLVFVLRVNLSSFLLAFSLFSIIAYAFDPVFHIIGLNVLTAGALRDFWTALYNNTFFRLTNFYNSIVMGSLIFSILLFAPLFFILNYGVRKYRAHVLAWMKKTPLARAISGSRLYEYYMSYAKMREKL